MATTKYEVLCRYYNMDMKMPITNIVNETWVSFFEDTIPKGSYSKETFEFCKQSDPIQERKIQDLLIYGNNSSNPKFNMFFMYNSRDFMYSNKGTDDFPYVLVDRMEKVPLSPWFIHSTHAEHLLCIYQKPRKMLPLEQCGALGALILLAVENLCTVSPPFRRFCI